MLGKYASRVRRLTLDARAAVAEELELDLPARGGLVQALNGAGCGSADVVLALLRREMVDAASMVAGTPVQRCPAHVPPLRPRAAVVPQRHGDDLQLVHVQRPCPVRPNTPAARRYALLRRHMSVRSALARGVTRRDLLRWQAAGYLRLEDDT